MDIIDKRELEFQTKPEEVQFLWKKIDRKLKIATTDSEIAGKPIELLQSADNLPLVLDGVDSKINALGALSTQELVNQILSQTANTANRQVRYRRLKDALEHPEITGALNIYADEATTEDSDGEIFHVMHSNEDVVKIVEDLIDRVGIREKSWEIIRNMCAYGDDFREVVLSKNLSKILKLVRLPREMLERVEENAELKYFRVAKFNQSDPISYSYWQVHYQTKEEDKENIIYPFRILHFRINSSKYEPYGESIIDSVITAIEMLSIMEKALLIARVTRAPERRIFNIDVGTLSGDMAIKYAENVVKNFKSRKRLDLFLRDRIDYQRDIWGVTEDVAIPKRQGAEGNSIDTLPQLNQPAVEDLDWIRDKIFPGLGIPRQYLLDDSFANANLNLSSKSVPFAKRIRRVQRHFLKAIYKLAFIELKLNGFGADEIAELTIVMNNPSNIDEKERIEIDMQRWALIASMMATNANGVFIPDYVIYRDVLQLSDDEIVEWMKLSQLQAAQKNIFEAFPEDERPEGYEDLVPQGPPPGAEGEMMGGGGMPMGGEMPAEGGEMPIEGEGGEAEGEIPADVADALGPPPVPAGGEVAHYIPNVQLDKTYLETALERKKSFLDKITKKTISHTVPIKLFSEEQIEKIIHRKIRTISVSYEEMEYDGDLNGLDKILKQKEKISKKHFFG